MAKMNATVERLAPVLGYRVRKGAVALVSGSDAGIYQTRARAYAKNAAHVAVHVPPFRIFGTLALAGQVTPVIKSAGTGCADDYCLWIVGENLEASVAVELLRGNGTMIAEYRDGDATLDVATQVVTLRLRDGSPEKGLLASTGVGVRLRNRGSGRLSNVVTVQRPGATPPAPAVPPVITNAGAGCDDNYCLWIISTALTASVTVELLDATGALLAVYRDGALALNLAEQVITLRLQDASAERALFTSASLGVRLADLTSGLRSNVVVVTRP